jgi:hypothetical protein
VVGVVQEFLRDEFQQLCSTISTFLPGARPVRLETRKMCVSTAMVGWPNAVFRPRWRSCGPRPARLPAPRGFRHFAAVLLEQDLAGGDDVLGLGAEQADGRM